MAVTLRGTEKARSILKKFAALENKSQSAVLEEALEAYERQQFCEKLRNGYDRLRKDDNAWSEFRREIEEFDGAMADGLPVNGPPRPKPRTRR